MSHNLSDRALPFPLARIGIIGGGQLGRMMVRKATQLGFAAIVLDPTPNSPAGQVAGHQIVGDFFDPAKLRELAELSNVTTFDIETIDSHALEELLDEGFSILPSPHLLATIQNKLSQKQLLADQGIATGKFVELEEPTPAALAEFGYPLVQKAQRGGYDGRGVEIFHDDSEPERILPVPSLLEEYIDCELELAVMVARGLDGATRVYPVVEMVFDLEANILDKLVAPARITPEQAQAAQDLAVKTIEAIDGVGVFGVELFLAKDGRLLVNEIAPRTHNSGHYTIEACVTDQFEQQIRAITGLPLGSTEQLKPAVMINLLGAAGSSGRTIVEGLDDALAIDGVAVHIYGKAESRPLRKMGHVTVIDDTIEAASAKAEQVRELLKIRGERAL
ncbi:5-(carboxyamino)imidazole ribonucleotide synthase [Methylohalomonas lacus]|uniref:N5-carboxyaminoimidazole ribonucleotide synthase n=1 Tax=Methylohalomonas lacus TaxID=398773 RepID=A0AAE3HM52_9GAMM|nr:5-(carboxyamino)imidazole ribonucleotide synthase [Methylohalomonas lacus]MCS3903676.1 5-(carboxyamino)imidazole ribonucleotide synthase [Methylohalomonas lacus]